MKKKENKGEIKYTKYIIEDDKYFYPSSNVRTTKNLPPGYYDLKYSNNTGHYVMKRDVITDELLRLPLKIFRQVLDDIDTFWHKESKFDEYGLVFKRGILLHGPPGAGKSCLIKLLCDDLIKNKNGIVLRVLDRRDLNLYSDFMEEMFRAIEPDRPVITILEDIDGLCEDSDSETSLLNILDGITQSRKVVYVATTNYIDKLKSRIINRPSRFDKIYHVNLPDEKIRRFYLEHKIKESDLINIDIDLWVQETDTFTYAHMRDLIVSVLILGNDFDETVKHLKEMNALKAKSSNKRRVGFDSDEANSKYAEYDEDYNEDDYGDDDYEDTGIEYDDDEDDSYQRKDTPGGW